MLNWKLVDKVDGSGKTTVALHRLAFLNYKDSKRFRADRMLVVRETIAAVAHQHEMVATMLPKVLEDEAGNGCHVHLSLWREDTNCMSDGPQSFTPEAEAFVAGLLEHLPALMALTAPSPASARPRTRLIDCVICHLSFVIICHLPFVICCYFSFVVI